jgi:hypothetical protein
VRCPHRRSPPSSSGSSARAGQVGPARFNSCDHRNWFDPGNDCQKVANMASSDDGADTDEGALGPSHGAGSAWTAKYTAQLRQYRAIDEELPATTAPPGTRGAHLLLPRSSQAPAAPMPACFPPRAATAHRGFHPRDREGTPGSPAPRFRSPLTALLGPSRSRFATGGTLAARGGTGPAASQRLPGCASRKYREEEFGACSCQQRRAWLPLPKSGLHGFRERRYR